MSPLLIEEDRGPVRVLTLNRPEKRNALNAEIQDALYAGLQAADADPAIACVLLRANGPVFCAGADLAEHNDGAARDPAIHAARLQSMARLQTVMSGMDKPVVAAVQGAAIGAGAGLAIAADFVLMAASAKIGYPEVPHGMVPTLMVPGLVRRIDPRRALELLLLGDILTAQQALAAGLVNRVVADADLAAAALALAERLGAMNPAAVAATKRLFHEVLDLSLREGVAASVRATPVPARREGTPQAGTSREDTPGEGAPREGTSGRGTPREGI